MNHKKGQSAIEFVLLISFMVVVFFGFFFAIQSQIVDTTNKQLMQTLQEADNIVKINIELARQSYPDFSNKFTLPDLGNNIYAVYLEENNTLVSKIDYKEYIDFLQYDVKGKIKTGSKYENTIYHNDGNYIGNNSKIKYDPLAKGIFLNIDSEWCAKEKDNGNCNPDCKSIGVCS